MSNRKDYHEINLLFHELIKQKKKLTPRQYNEELRELQQHLELNYDLSRYRGENTRAIAVHYNISLEYYPPEDTE